MEEPINIIQDGYLKRNFITIPTATATLSLQEAMKRSLQVYNKRKKRLEAYARKPKVDKLYLFDLDQELSADADLYNYALKLIERLDVVERGAGLEFDQINNKLIAELAENMKLIEENRSLRKQIAALRNGTH